MLFSSSSRGKLRLAGSPELVPGAAFPRPDCFPRFAQRRQAGACAMPALH